MATRPGLCLAWRSMKNTSGFWHRLSWTTWVTHTLKFSSQADGRRIPCRTSRQTSPRTWLTLAQTDPTTLPRNKLTLMAKVMLFLLFNFEREGNVFLALCFRRPTLRERVMFPCFLCFSRPTLRAKVMFFLLFMLSKTNFEGKRNVFLAFSVWQDQLWEKR